MLSVLYEEVKREEQAIATVADAGFALGEKHYPGERMTTAMQDLYNPKAEINRVMHNPPTYLAYIDESVRR